MNSPIIYYMELTDQLDLFMKSGGSWNSGEGRQEEESPKALCQRDTSSLVESRSKAAIMSSLAPNTS